MQKQRSYGFTLVEVAVVLVVIGLLAGSVVVGHDLIRSSEIQSVISDVTRYKQAVDAFQQKYGGLPGDITNAESIWGTDPGGCPNTSFTNIPHTSTCNGNGDGHVSYSNGTLLLNAPEAFRFWQQLANAGLIEGSYTGVSGTGSTYNTLLGVNVPSGKQAGSGFYLKYRIRPNGGTQDWPMVTHEIQYGAVCPLYSTTMPNLTPAEALSLDQKIDDGMPGTGKVTAYKHSVYTHCTTGDDASSSVYNTSFSAIACSLHFLMGF